MTDAKQFADVIAKAMRYDPDEIEATIRDLAVPFPGGAGEPVAGGATSDPTANAVIANLTRRGPNRDLTDVFKLHVAEAAFVRNIAHIADATSSMEPPDTWAEALVAGNYLVELDVVAAAIGVGVRLRRHIDRAADAVDTVQRVHDGHCAHEPPPSVAELNTSWCRPHLRIGVNRKRISKMCCQMCWRDISDVADVLGLPAVELQLDPKFWPSEAMQRARADGRRVLFGKERQSWLRGLGVDPVDVERRRRAVRAGA